MNNLQEEQEELILLADTYDNNSIYGEYNIDNIYDIDNINSDSFRQGESTEFDSRDYKRGCRALKYILSFTIGYFLGIGLV